MVYLNVHFLLCCLLFISDEGKYKCNKGSRLKVFSACTIGMQTKALDMMKVKNKKGDLWISSGFIYNKEEISSLFATVF